MLSPRLLKDNYTKGTSEGFRTLTLQSYLLRLKTVEVGSKNIIKRLKTLLLDDFKTVWYSKYKSYNNIHYKIQTHINYVFTY